MAIHTIKKKHENACMMCVARCIICRMISVTMYEVRNKH